MRDGVSWLRHAFGVVGVAVGAVVVVLAPRLLTCVLDRFPCLGTRPTDGFHPVRRVLWAPRGAHCARCNLCLTCRLPRVPCVRVPLRLTAVSVREHASCHERTYYCCPGRRVGVDVRTNTHVTGGARPAQGRALSSCHSHACCWPTQYCMCTSLINVTIETRVCSTRGAQVWEYIMENEEAILGPVNPFNGAIQAKFGDQGGYF